MRKRGWRPLKVPYLFQYLRYYVQLARKSLNMSFSLILTTGIVRLVCSNGIIRITDLWVGCLNFPLRTCGSRYSRMDQVKFVEDSLLLGPFLNTLIHIFLYFSYFQVSILKELLSISLFL